MPSYAKVSLQRYRPNDWSHSSWPVVVAVEPLGHRSVIATGLSLSSDPCVGRMTVKDQVKKYRDWLGLNQPPPQQPPKRKKSKHVRNNVNNGIKLVFALRKKSCFCS